MGDGQPAWVAVAPSKDAAEQWAWSLLEHLTDPRDYSGRHFAAMVAMAGEQAVKMRIPPR